MGNRIRILFIIGALGIGGKERQLIEIINNLSTDKYEIQLIIKEKNGYYIDLIDKEKCKIHDVNWNGYRLIDHFQAFKYIKKQIDAVNDFKPDFAISFSIEMSYLYVISRLFFKEKLNLVNFTIRDAPINLNQFFKLKRFLYNFFKYVAANSKAGLKAYNQENKSNRFVLYNGFDEKRICKIEKNELREKFSFAKNKFIVISIANLTNKKDHQTLIKAITIIEKKYLNEMQFFLVGDGDKRNIIQKDISNNGLENYVYLLGRRNDIEEILKASDLTVLCSYTEGISNSVIESMFTGIPVIATGEGGLLETIRNDYNGYCYPIGDYKSLSQKIIDLYIDRTKLKILSKNATQFANENFSLNQMIENFESILIDIKNNVK